MTSMATANGAIRVLPAGKIPHPVGDPGRPADAEAAWRKTVVDHAARALAEPIKAARVFS